MKAWPWIVSFPLSVMIACSSAQETDTGPRIVLFVDCARQEQYNTLAASRTAETLSPGQYLEGIELLMSESHLRESIVWAGDALERYPDDVPLLLSYARVWSAAEGDSSKEAKGAVNDALQIDPVNPAALLMLGYMSLSAHELDAAAAAFNGVLQYSNGPHEHLSAHLGLASAFKEVGDDAASDVHLEQARAILPNLDQILIDGETLRLGQPPRFAGRPHNHSNRLQRIQEKVLKSRAARDAGGVPCNSGT